MTPSFAEFSHRRVVANGVNLHVRIGGSGPPLVLLHGWPQHSLMWHAIAPRLADRFTVIAPDQRGAGGSDIPGAGYDKATMADDLRALLDALELPVVRLAAYDLGCGVAFSFAARHPDRVAALAVMEFGLPGFGYEQFMMPTAEWTNASNWHLSFFTLPDVAEMAFRGRERELLTWFFWHLSCNPSAVSEEHLEEYVRQVAKPGALRAGIQYYAAVWEDARHNTAIARERLRMPVLAMGGEASAGPYAAQLWQPVAEDVRGVSIPGAGHWLGDENPAAVADALRAFFAEARGAT